LAVETPVQVKGSGRRRIPWPVIVVAIVIAALLIIVGSVYGIVALATTPHGDPAATVLKYDKAYRDVDCSLYESVTTAEFRDESSDDGYDCDSWMEIAASYTIDGVYHYTVKVTSTRAFFGTATVYTKENDDSGDSPVDYEFRYGLNRPGDHWLISSVDDVSP
jgi:hypothetical protein